MIHALRYSFYPNLSLKITIKNTSCTVHTHHDNKVMNIRKFQIGVHKSAVEIDLEKYQVFYHSTCRYQVSLCTRNAFFRYFTTKKKLIITDSPRIFPPPATASRFVWQNRGLFSTNLSTPIDFDRACMLYAAV